MKICLSVGKKSYCDTSLLKIHKTVTEEKRSCEKTREITSNFSQLKKVVNTHYGFRFAATCKSSKLEINRSSSKVKYLLLFLCFILELKIQGHAQLAITFCVQSCENAFLRESVLPHFYYFSLLHDPNCWHTSKLYTSHKRRSGHQNLFMHG